MARHCFIIADDPERKSQTRAVDPPADQIDHRRQDHEIDVDIRLGQVGQDIQTARPGEIVLYPGHQGADHLGEAQREDHEIDPGQP